MKTNESSSFTEKYIQRHGVKAGLWMLVCSQLGYFSIKLTFIIFFRKPIESLFPEWMGNSLTHEALLVLVIFYFGIISIWLCALTYAVWHITNEKQLSENQKWQIFKEVFFNSHEIRKKKPKKGKWKISLFYGTVFVTAPWIWLTAIHRFTNVKAFFKPQKE